MKQIPVNRSARRTLVGWQRVAAPAVVVSATLAGVLSPYATATVLVAFGTAYYVLAMAWKARMVHASLRDRTERDPPPMLDDADLPTYTLLVPLYDEGDVVAGLVDHLARMDYPTDKLQVLLLCEQHDHRTLNEIMSTPLPSFAELVMLEPGSPQTKPRACNLGLARATGDLCVIYDAEDRPEPDQLRVAASEFARADDDVVCLQARLDYHNARQGPLTRWFAVEYDHWYELLLPALAKRRMPLPLGGTSNHFRTEVLRDLGGWDAYNVTEDADLGIRLYTHGYRTGIVDSVTWEEACSEIRPWIRQRTRWTKGYMLTFLVHIRSLRWVRTRPAPIRAFAAFALLVGGTPFVNLINPIFWTMLFAHAATRSELIIRIFPAPVLYMGVLSLVVGNLLIVYTYLAGVERTSRYYLARAAVLSPFYWALMSLATWRAVGQLVLKPHLWEKTPHGLAPSVPVVVASPRPSVVAGARVPATVLAFERPAHGSSSPVAVELADHGRPATVPSWFKRVASVAATFTIGSALVLLLTGAAQLIADGSLVEPPEDVRPDLVVGPDEVTSAAGGGIEIGPAGPVPSVGSIAEPGG